MGCDIRVHVEVKINGVWEHYSCPYIGRDYALFSKMAGVRQREEVTAISQPRGMPDDASRLTQFDHDNWGSDGHSHSWLSAAEAGEVQEWYQRLRKSPSGNSLWHPPLFGYVFGNDVDSYVKYPTDGDDIRALGFEDVRIVFWFDN